VLVYIVGRVKHGGGTMPRVSEIKEPGTDPVLTQIFEQERAVFGDLLNPTKVLAHCPPILRAAKLLGASIEQSGQLPTALLSLVNFRVASINGCPF
jgi:alkylhydroperoxidase family enzyme